jgi:hypothetical protein
MCNILGSWIRIGVENLTLIHITGMELWRAVDAHNQSLRPGGSADKWLQIRITLMTSRMDPGIKKKCCGAAIVLNIVHTEAPESGHFCRILLLLLVRLERKTNI